MKFSQVEWSGLFGRELAVIALPLLIPKLAAKLCGRAGLEGTVGAVGAAGFDVAYYQAATKCKFGSTVGALFHYLMIGSRRGLRPNAEFDPTYYRRANQDVVLAGCEPFAHYVRFGRHEGRSGVLGADGQDHDSVVAPDINLILSRGRPHGAAATVDIVIPLHGSRTLALQTIDSVLAAGTDTNSEIVVVDDASRDRTLRQDLRLLADHGLITLLTNDDNLGFAASVNRGMALHPTRDVVLLNSDTKVHGDWLERLLRVLRSGANVGTATPLSNAATILSYPIPLRDNNMPVGIDNAALDLLCARLALEPVELPTAVGFCMAISRNCLDAIGPFDVARFGRGYGEENDFCLRASALGWRHLAATNVFVWHRGGASFGTCREGLVAAAQITLEQVHPGYQSKVRRFISRNPLNSIRGELDAARVAADPRRKILLLNPAGDTEDSSEEVLRIRLVRDICPHSNRYRFVAHDLPSVPNLPTVDQSTSQENLVEMMTKLAIKEVRLQRTSLFHSLRSKLLRAANEVGASAHFTDAC